MSENSPLSDTLIYAAQLPVSWSGRQEGDLLPPADNNLELLHCINLLGEQLHTKLDDESELDSALMRVEAKLDMVLGLLSTMIKRELDIPAASNVRLTAKGVEWTCNDRAPEIDESIWISLYMDPRLPAALLLPAKVVSVDKSTDGDCVVVCRFTQVEEGVQQLLEKMIFRHHRRQVAMSRS
jgi:hypothetical protein